MEKTAPKRTFARRSAPGDRPDRRGDARAADRARRDHRPPDRRQKNPGIRLGFPPGARSGHDAPARAAPSRQPAARYRREHLAGHHLNIHLRPGAVFGSCRPVGRRCADARFRAIPFRLHGAVRAAHGRGERGPGGDRIEGRSGPRARLRHRRRRPVVDRRSNSTPRQRLSPGCRSSSAPTIRRLCRYSSSRA